MFLGRAIACAMVIVAAGTMEQGGAQSTTRFDDFEKLSAVDRARVDRAVQVSTGRYDEWLGVRPTAPESRPTDAPVVGVAGIDGSRIASRIRARARAARPNP